VRTGIAQAIGDTSSVAWLWFGALALVLLLVITSATLVPSGQRRVVTRQGRVRRVVERRIAWRVPLLERFEAALSMPHDLPVGVRATTLDGAPVLVLLDTVATILPPEPGALYADPWPAAEEVVQAEMRTLVSRLPVVELHHALRAAERSLRGSVRDELLALGVDLTRIEVVEVDLPLAGDRGPD
jgi:regulator of protease activity HflC (stomatin/prohibitin superfamily)